MNGSQNYLDCYVRWEDACLIIGNRAIERAFFIEEMALRSLYVLNKDTGHRWERPSERAVQTLPGNVSITAEVSENGGLSKPCLLAAVEMSREDRQIRYLLTIFPESPFISVNRMIKGNIPLMDAAIEESAPTGIELNDRAASQTAVSAMDWDLLDRLSLPDRHYKITAVNLSDKTDNNDALAVETKQNLYKRGSYRAVGNLFLLEDYLADEGLLVVKESPTPSSALARRNPDIHIKGNHTLELLGTGLQGGEDYRDWVYVYGCTVGTGSPPKILSAYKRQYKNEYIGYGNGHNYTMSNTWGDRNQDGAVNHAFISREIELAHTIGLDIVQIDDGWQKGITQNSKLARGGVWEGYYAVDPDFWTVNPEKFPQGLEPLTEQAGQCGVRLGLWFSPDSSNDFANWKRDTETLLELYRRYGVAHFKLDGVKIRSKYAERNFISFMEAVSARSGNAIQFNLDITAEDRFGYLYQKQFGNLFVENRYTDWGNYYPHSTLRNLWTLSRYFPTDKFQFELLNNKRNPQVYADDPLAPGKYPIGYLFAAVMPANPLLFMELSGLDDASILDLQAVVSAYNAHRSAFVGAEVLPLGDIPDGTGFTGFQIVCGSGSGYLLLFRECNDTAEYGYTLHGSGAVRQLEGLYATDSWDWKAIPSQGDRVKLSITFAQPGTALFLKYTLA